MDKYLPAFEGVPKVRASMCTVSSAIKSDAIAGKGLIGSSIPSRARIGLVVSRLLYRFHYTVL